MKFDKVQYTKLRGGIKIVLQDIINNEFKTKIKDKQIVKLLTKLQLPEQIEVLNDRYEKSGLVRVREKIDDNMKGKNKVKFANNMKDTLINNQAIFNERGNKYGQILLTCAIYPQIIEALTKNDFSP